MKIGCLYYLKSYLIIIFAREIIKLYLDFLFLLKGKKRKGKGGHPPFVLLLFN